MEKVRLSSIIEKKISGEWGTEGNPETGVIILRTTNFTNKGKIDFEKVVYRDIPQKKIDQKKLKDGDIIIEKSGGSPAQPVGRVVYFSNPDRKTYLCNNFTTILRPKSDLVYSKFLFYSLFNLYQKRATVKYQNKTTGIINLKLDNYLKEEISIFPLSSQIRIAKVLSWAEELIEDRRKSIDLLDDLLRSTFLEMFGDPVRNEKGWRKDSIISFASSIVPGRDKPKSFTGNIPWINTVDLQNLGFIDKSKSDTGLTVDEINEVKAKIIPMNSILMTCVGDLGIVSICKKDVVINQQLHSFQCKANINNIFVMYCLSFQKAFMYRMATTTTVPYMNKTTCNSIPMISPPSSLQSQFAEIVEKVEAVKRDYKESLIELENLYASLSQRAFSGNLNLDKLDVQKELEEHNKKIDPTKENIKKEEPTVENDSKVALHTVTSGLSIAFAEYGKLYETIEKLPKLPLSGLEAAIAAQSTLKNISETVALNGISAVSNYIDLLQKQNEKINQSISPFLPGGSLLMLMEAQKKINKIMGTDIYKSEYFTPRQVIDTIINTWKAGTFSFNTQHIAKILRENFTDYHFNFEMALNCIKLNLDDIPYFSTEERIKEPEKKTDLDLCDIFVSALEDENPFFRLKQSFYDGERENFDLKLRDEDYASFQGLSKEKRSGIYFSLEPL